MRRLPPILVLLVFTACSSTPTLVAMRGQNSGQQEADSKACDAEVGNDQGGAMGGNRSVTLGAIMAGAVGAAKAKEAQEKFDACMKARGYQVKSE